VLLEPSGRHRSARGPTKDEMTHLLTSTLGEDHPAPVPPATPPVRVVAVPAAHPYVAGVTAAPGVTVLPDPLPAGAEPGHWWPPVALDPAWIATHAADADLLHVHFGTESFSPEHLARTLDAARAAGWPVVLTVHDLDHPQLTDQAPYAAQLDVLVPGADAVLTLTDGAAAEVRARWSRDALVVPHPRLLADGAVPGGAPAPDGAVLVGLHLKDLRPNVDAVGATRALATAVGTLTRDGRPARAEVRVHRQVRDAAARDAVREICAAAPGVQLVEHDRLDDAALAASLARLDACVLPYAHGTHSGWLELCWDLGVPVAAPAVGHYADQHPDGSVASFAGGSGAALAAALTAVLDHGTATRPGTPARAGLVRDRRDRRRADDARVSAVHADLYRRLLADRRR
jgi:hypothetical protein